MAEDKVHDVDLSPKHNSADLDDDGNRAQAPSQFEEHFQMKFNLSDIKDEELYTVIEDIQNQLNIEWDERLNLNQNNDRKKKIKEKILLANKGKFVVDFNKVWSQGDTYDLVPTDIIMILKDETDLEEYKSEMINRLKHLGFNPKISSISGGENLNFESICQSQSFKIPVKFYTRKRKIMVQGTPDCQSFFIKHFQSMQAVVNANNASNSDQMSDKSTHPKEPVDNSIPIALPKPVMTNSSTPNDIPESTCKNSSPKILPHTPITPSVSVTPSSIANKFLERSGAVLSPARIAQISQIKDTVGTLETKFVDLKLLTENKLEDTISKQTFDDKIFSLTQSHKTEIRILQSRCHDLEMAKEVLSNKVKTLEEQNKCQFKQIGKLEGSLNTLTTLVKDLFQNNKQSDITTPKLISEEVTISNIPTSNQFTPLDTSINSSVDETKINSESNCSQQDFITNPSNRETILRASAKPYTVAAKENHTYKSPTVSTTQSPNIWEEPQRHRVPLPPIYVESPMLYPGPPNHIVGVNCIPGQYQQNMRSTNQYQGSTYYSAGSNMPQQQEVTSKNDGLNAPPTAKQSNNNLPDKVFSSTVQQKQTNSKQDQIVINAGIVLLMDSNGSHIDPDLLYPIEGSTSKKLYCPLTKDINNLVHDVVFAQPPKIIVIHCGTNDLDYNDAKSVIDSLSKTVQVISNKFMSSKIIVSGLLPRKDFPTRDIFNFNNDLARKFQLLPNIHFVDHNNLQDDDTSSILTDKKHLNDAGIKLFSKNLKDCIFGRIQRKVRAKRVMSPPRMSKYEFPANKETMRSKRPYKKSGNKHSRYDRDSDD